MRTRFSLAQLADPDIESAERSLRACVHCGICTATCPTYVLTGDERDGPRGRIVMMQKMLEADAEPSAEAVHHIDRCLGCLECRTACPSSVDYASIADAARAHIATRYRRPPCRQLMRNVISVVMSRPLLVGLGAAVARLLAPLVIRLPGQIGAAARQAVFAENLKERDERYDEDAALPVTPTAHVALMPGCVQRALAPSIDRAAARVLGRRGIALKVLRGAACCGALAHHLGHRSEAKALAQRAIAAFEKDGRHEAVLITASGCAAHLLDYPRLFAGEPEWHARAKAFADKVKDFSELATPRKAEAPLRLRLALHIPCSLQNGVRRGDCGAAGLAAACSEVLPIPESHFCCGSAGSYSLLQPQMAFRLRERKLANIATLKPDAIASANIGCLLHLSGADAPPVLHPAELIDWAEGGPVPMALQRAKSPVKGTTSG
ncbi:MAG TPA: glycolate oxidase subunit GlcF [Rhizomicrobium sp.]|nr:glycolate oxidase subunit GlcF [Rhizomicrobium sp.]